MDRDLLTAPRISVWIGSIHGTHHSSCNGNDHVVWTAGDTAGAETRIVIGDVAAVGVAAPAAASSGLVVMRRFVVIFATVLMAFAGVLMAFASVLMTFATVFMALVMSVACMGLSVPFTPSFAWVAFALRMFFPSMMPMSVAMAISMPPMMLMRTSKCHVVATGADLDGIGFGAGIVGWHSQCAGQ